MGLIVFGLVIHSVLLILLWMNLNDVQERKTSSRDFLRYFFLYHLYIKYKTSGMFEEISSEMQMCLISLRKYWITILDLEKDKIFIFLTLIIANHYIRWLGFSLRVYSE